MESKSSRRVAVVSQHLGLSPSTPQQHVVPQNTSADVVRELLVRGSHGSKKEVDVQSLKNFVGKEVGVSPWLRITQERVNAFADATGDWQWIHIDPERAKKESPFGGPVAHGYLTISLAPLLQKEASPQVTGVKAAVNYGLNKLRFISPVHVGANLRVKVVLKEVKDIKGGIQVVSEVTFEVEGGDKPAAIAETVALYYF